MYDAKAEKLSKDLQNKFKNTPITPTDVKNWAMKNKYCVLNSSDILSVALTAGLNFKVQPNKEIKPYKFSTNQIDEKEIKKAKAKNLKEMREKGLKPKPVKKEIEGMTKEKLIELMEELSIPEIGKKVFNVCQNKSYPKVKELCERYEVDYYSYVQNKKILAPTKEELEIKYIIYASTLEIAKVYDVSLATITHWFRKYGITKETRLKEAARRLGVNGQSTTA